MENFLFFSIISIPIILISITVHEYAHGMVAEIFGDPTPRMSGRMTLNPLAHIDPLGLLMLVLVRFGWAKPVPINPNYFKDPEKDMAIVGLAGPAANFILAWLVSLVFRFFTLTDGFLVDIVQFTMWINIALGVFNLLPVPPLDGSRLLKAVLPRDMGYALDSIEPYGIFILVGLLIFPGTSSLIFFLVNLIFSLLV